MPADSLLHGLRLLGSLHQCLHPIADHDKTADLVVPNNLEDAVCKVTALLPASFKAFDYAMYPVLPQTNQAAGHEAAFANMLGQVNSQNEYYLLIAKQLWPGGSGISTKATFKVALKLPVTGNFNELNDVLAEAIQSDVQKAMEDKFAELLGGVTSVTAAEIAGVQKLEALLKKILDNSFVSTLTEPILQKGGFYPLLGTPSSVTRSGDQYNGNQTTDYAGLKVGGLDVANEADGIVMPFPIKILITDNQNYGPGSDGGFSAADAAFKAASAKMVFWLHYFTADNGATQVVYLKTKNNLTPEENEAYLEAAFNAYRTAHPPVVAKPSDNAQRFACPNWQLSPSWRTKDNVLDCIDSNADLKKVLDVFPAVASDAALYYAGLASGFIDAALDEIGFLYEISCGVSDFARYAPTLLSPGKRALLLLVPGGTVLLGSWMGDVIRRAAMREYTEKGLNIANWQLNFAAANAENLRDANLYWYKIAQTFALFTDATKVSQMFREFLGSMKDWLADSAGLNGPKEQGWQHGAIIFNTCMGLVSGGFSIQKNIIKEITETISQKGMGSFLRTKVGNLDDAFKKFKCTVLALGCFVAGTEVHTAAGAVPIEQMRPDCQLLADHKNTIQPAKGYVLSYSHQAGKEEEGIDSKGEPDQEEISPDTHQWVELRMVAEDGAELNAWLLRSKQWLNKQNATALGDEIWLQLIEMGISGRAKISAFYPCTVDTKNLIFATKDKHYAYRPITGWFERSAPEVWDYVFATGATIRSTPNHPFFSADRQAYVPVGNLGIGERVKLAGERTATLVSKWVRENGQEKVYNLEVWRDHNFHVGVEGLLVHNSCLKNYLDSFFPKWTRKKDANHNWVDYLEESTPGPLKERQQLERLGEHTQERMIVLTKDKNSQSFPGIDALSDSGRPISLKEVISTNHLTLIQRVTEMGVKATKAKNTSLPQLEDIDGMVTAYQFTKAQIVNAIEQVRNTTPEMSIVKKIFIEGSDESGWYILD